MAPDGIVEPIDVAANGLVDILAGIEGGPLGERADRHSLFLPSMLSL